MNNTQLNINVNPDLLLNTLANNIGVDFISDGSNLKKMTDGYSNEHVTFKGIVNDAQSNLFVSSADARFLDLIGQQNGLFRKRYFFR